MIQMAFADGTAEARATAAMAGFDPHAMHAEQIRNNRARATDRAVQYLVDLSAERTPHVAEQIIRDWTETVDRALVSEKIDWLKTLPKVVNSGTGAKGTSVPEGRYAVTGDRGQTVFVRVQRPTEGLWKGRTFVQLQAGDELLRVSPATRDALLAKIEAGGPKTACVRYGCELGECGRCGRTLTDEASRAAGIGPVCAAKDW